MLLFVPSSPRSTLPSSPLSQASCVHVPAGALHKVTRRCRFSCGQSLGTPTISPGSAPSATSMPCLLWYLAIVAAPVVVVVTAAAVAAVT